MAGIAKPRTRIGKRIKDGAETSRELHSLRRRSDTPTNISASFAAGSPAAPQFGTVNFLPTAGGTMVGAIAFFPKLLVIATGAIDIGIDTDDFTSRVIVSTEAAAPTDDLVTITGAQHAGQLLFLQGVQTETITLKTTGNIETIDGNDFDIADDDIIILMFDTTDNKWQQVTTGKQGIAGTFATVALDNLVNPTLNTDIDWNTFDINNMDRIEFAVSSGAVSTAATPTIYLDASGDLTSNVAAGDNFAWTINNVRCLNLFPSTDDRVLNLQALDDGTPIIQLERTDSTPSAGASVGRIEFKGVDSSGTTSEEFGRIRVDAEDLTIGSVDGSMHFGVDINSTPITFFSINNSNEGKTRFFRNVILDTTRDLEINGNDIIFDSTGTNLINADSAGMDIHADGSGDTIAMIADGVTSSFSSTGLQLGLTADQDMAFRALQFTQTTATFLVDGAMFYDDTANKFKVRENGVTKTITDAGGDMVLADVQTVTGAKTFENTKLLLRNQADTQSGSFTHTAVINPVWTLPATSTSIAGVAIAQTWSAIQTHSAAIVPNADGTIELGGSSAHWDDVFSETFTLRGSGGNTIGSARTIYADSTFMQFNMPSGDGYEFTVDNSRLLQVAGTTLLLQGTNTNQMTITTSNQLTTGTEPYVISSINSRGQNSTPAAFTFSNIQTSVTDKTASTEDGTMEFHIAQSGVAANDISAVPIMHFRSTAGVQQIGFFNTTPAGQPSHIVDADGTLADITTKFNTLLADMAALGLQAAS